MNRCDSYFEKIFKNNYNEVYSFLLKKLGSSDDASDAAQDTFLRMAKCCGQTNISSPKSYLYRIARNVATDLLRSRASRSRHLDTADIEAQPSSLPSPDAELEFSQRQARMKQALDALPARCREVFILHRHENLTYREIAASLGISQKTVEKHISRAISQLQKAFFQP